MVGKAFLLVIIAAVSGSQTDSYICGKCLCTIHDDGCLTADCRNRSVVTPDQVPNQICALLMTDNEIQSIEDGEFQRFVNLTKLDLSSNRINEIAVGGFARLSKLTHLNLSSNNIDFQYERIKRDVFKPLINLTHLELKENSYNEYPHGHLGMLVSLKHLSLDGLQNRSFGSEFSHLDNLSSIDLSGNAARKCKISSLYKSTFDYVAQIRHLNMSYCNISSVEPGTFSPLQKIDTLDLSHNGNLLFTGVRDVTYGLQTSSLRHLIINKIVPDDAVCVVIDKTHVEYLENTSLQIIEANNDRIEQIDLQALSSLPKSLNHISAGDNRFTNGPYLKHLYLLTNLTSLKLSGNGVPFELLQDFSDSSYGCHTSCKAIRNEFCSLALDRKTEKKVGEDELVPPSQRKLPKVSVEYDQSSSRHVRIPPKLKTLNYSYSQLNYHLSHIYLAENSLDSINLSYNVLTTWNGPVQGVDNVTYLDLSNNFANYVNFHFFENFKSLKCLNISKNYLSRSIFHDYNGTLFRNLSNLETLDISFNDLIQIPYRFLEGLSSLKTLHLSENSIYTLDLNYTNNRDLQFINISDNQISYIPASARKTFDQLAMRNNLTIDLSWNPFTCACEPLYLEFLDWLNTTKVKLEYPRRYMCVVYENKQRKFRALFKIYPKLQESCKYYTALLMWLSSLVILITSLTLCAILYRYRWRLIYVYYVGKRKLRTVKGYETLYDFDAFVSYADQDTEFVRTFMLSRLECNQGLNLYVRDRDSVPGATIAENIIDGIQRSKKSILLISEASLAKKWNRYELQMANMEEISTKRNVMIIVMLEAVPSKDIPSEILYHIQKSPPFQYPAEDPRQIDMFWASLTEAVRS